MNRWWTRIVVALVAIGVGISIATLIRTQVPLTLDRNAKGVLAYITAAPPSAISTVSFNTANPLDTFHVYVLVKGSNRHYTIKLTGPRGTLLEMGQNQSMACTVGRDLPPGSYRVALTSDEGKGEIVAVVADRPVGLTGWQWLSRAGVALLILSAIALRWATRRGSDRQRRVAARVLRHLATVAFLIVLYLLLHEGAHAIASAAFGRFSLERSDFWGLGGSPHSGIRPDVQLLPWQYAVESIAGPLMPIMVACLVFLWWRSVSGRQWKSNHPWIDHLSSSLIVFFSLSAIIFPGYATGVLNDGDWRGLADNTSALTSQLLAWSVFLAGATVFVCTVRQVVHIWRENPVNTAMKS